MWCHNHHSTLVEQRLEPLQCRRRSLHSRQSAIFRRKSTACGHDRERSSTRSDGSSRQRPVIPHRKRDSHGRPASESRRREDQASAALPRGPFSFHHRDDVNNTGCERRRPGSEGAAPRVCEEVPKYLYDAPNWRSHRVIPAARIDIYDSHILTGTDQMHYHSAQWYPHPEWNDSRTRIGVPPNPNQSQRDCGAPSRVRARCRGYSVRLRSTSCESDEPRGCGGAMGSQAAPPSKALVTISWPRSKY